MHYYKIKIMKTDGYLKESVGDVPKELYVESEEPLDERNVLIRASKKFKNMYGAEITLADVEQISEGLWDRMKAHGAGMVNKVKNMATKYDNFKTKRGNNKLMKKAQKNARKEWNKNGQQGDVNAMTNDYISKNGGMKELKSGTDPKAAKVLSIFKSKINKLKKFLADTDNDFREMGINLKTDYPEVFKKWDSVRTWSGTFMRTAEKALGPNAKGIAPEKRTGGTKNKV